MKVTRPTILKVEEKEKTKEYKVLVIKTPRGNVETRYYPGAKKEAAIFVGGIGGGFDSPAKDLYPKLGVTIAHEGIVALRIKFRFSTDLNEAVYDVLAAIDLLKQDGITSICLVGHSFGGAVAIVTGTLSPIVSSVVTLATQSYGAEGITRLSPRPVLLIHGAQDQILTSSSSVWLYHKAQEPKKIILYEKTGHILDEAAEEIYTLLKNWILHPESRLD